MMNKNLISLAVGSVLCASAPIAFAKLPVKANLSLTNGTIGVVSCVLGTVPPCTNTLFNQTGIVGSFFNLGGDTLLVGNNGVTLGTIQSASGSHPGAADGSEVPNIDAPWFFSSNTGMHQTTSAVTILNDDLNGTVQLDFSGWNVTWNGIAGIPMGGGTQDCGTAVDSICVTNSGTDIANVGGVPFNNGTSIAIMTCDVNCSAGESYVIDAYAANVPQADPSNFGGAPYTLHLEGVITDTNQAPVATLDPIIQNVVSSGGIALDLVGNVSDPDGDGINIASFSIDSVSANGRTPTVLDDGLNGDIAAGDGVFQYIPNAAEADIVDDTVTYTVADNLGKTSTFTVTMSVITGPLPPIAEVFAVNTNKGIALDIDVVTNHTFDNDGTVSSVPVLVTLPVGGTAVADPGTGLVTFTPDPAFVGAGSFSYQVQDNLGALSNIATVTVNVNPSPVANPDSATVDRNSSVEIAVLTNDTSVDIATLNLGVDGTKGAAIFDATTGIFTYTPTLGASTLGDDTFTYTINDVDGNVLAPGLVTVTIVNAVPIANDDAASINVADNTSVAIAVTANDTDADGTVDALTANISTNPANGSVTIDASGNVVYTPNVDFVGTDSFTYTITDADTGTSTPATVTVSVSNGTGILSPTALLGLQAGLVESDAVEPNTGDGSWFSMELTPGAPTHIAVVGFNSIQLGTTQLGSVQPPPGPSIDEPWLFVGNLGVHQTTGDLVILTDDGAGNVTLDFSVWDVSWNNIPSIPLGEGASNGVATMTCFVGGNVAAGVKGDCSNGDGFIIDYRATVPPGDPSNFGGVKYHLHFEGLISVDAPTYGRGDANATFDVKTIVAIDENSNVVTVSAGTTSMSANNATGVNLTAEDINVVDPLFNPGDGVQCLGGCIDFVVSGVTGDYIDLVFTLNAPLPNGGKLRKLINGVWGDFDTSAGGQIGSGAINEPTQTCQLPTGVFDIGLREGNRCLFMRIYDGGPNDADGVKNGTIVDPSGVLVAGSPNTPPSSKSSGALGWASLGFVLVLLSLIRIKRT